MRPRPQRVDVVHDPDDDIAVQVAIRRLCKRGSGRLVIAPSPGISSERQLAVHIFMAHRPALPTPPEWPEIFTWCRQSHRLGQLALFPEHVGRRGWTASAAAVQLPLFPTSERLEQITAYLAVLSLGQAAHLLECDEIRELYVLQAQALKMGTWSVLRRLGAKSGTRICLVVSGTEPVTSQLVALSECRVHHRQAPRPRRATACPPVGPWWSRPSYRAAPTATRAALPARLTLPMQRPASLPGTPLFRVFRALSRVEGWGQQPGVLLAPAPVAAEQVPRIDPARLAAALRRVVDRLGEASPADQPVGATP